MMILKSGSKYVKELLKNVWTLMYYMKLYIDMMHISLIRLITTLLLIISVPTGSLQGSPKVSSCRFFII